MKKTEMVAKTMEGFIRKLREEGYPEYANELRFIVAMSRHREDATQAIRNIANTLLTHILKYIAMPQSKNRGGWLNEIESYFAYFDTHNISFKNRPWYTIEEIEKELDSYFIKPGFLRYLKSKLKDYSEKDSKNVLNLVNSRKTLKDLGVELFLGPENDLNIRI